MRDDKATLEFQVVEMTRGERARLTSSQRCSCGHLVVLHERDGGCLVGECQCEEGRG